MFASAWRKHDYDHTEYISLAYKVVIRPNTSLKFAQDEKGIVYPFE